MSPDLHWMARDWTCRSIRLSMTSCSIARTMHRDRAHCHVALSEQGRTESHSRVTCIHVRSPCCVGSVNVTTLDFVYQTRPSRVVFGAGSLQHLEREVLLLGAERALILSTPEQRGTAEAMGTRLGARAAGVFDRAVMHVPIEVAREAREVAQSLNADCAIAIGGGSTIGLGKAIALESGLSILAIPTTYAGSEMTPIYGITEGGLKRTATDGRLLPTTGIYDPALTITLPVNLSITSGINASAHGVEGLYARETNPVMGLKAEESIR